MSKANKIFFALLLLLFAVGCGGGGGSDSSVQPNDEISSAVSRWNRIAIDASGRDHEPNSAAEQQGPTRSSRAMAIVHLGMFDALVAITGGYRPYGNPVAPDPGASPTAAVAQAARDALVDLYPSQAAIFEAEYRKDLATVTDGDALQRGIRVGKEACNEILEVRKLDGSELPENYEFSEEPGFWRLDPLNPGQRVLGSEWEQVVPFVLAGASQFRLPPPPALGSAEYAAAFDQVKRLGGDGLLTPTERTPEQTEIGIFWAYDGTPSLCAPPRLYNQILVQVANAQGTTGIEFARLVALVNLALADAGVASWDSKYFYSYWRPVTGIREADEGTGPTGKGDGNPATIGDENFVPLGAPASNASGTDFTPPFPAYPSGHATFGGALFQSLRNFYGTDDISFSFVSDELNGTTRDSDGNVRPLVERSFSSLSQAEAENGQSRIYLGIHWSFDSTTGITLGNQVADYVFSNALQPIN